MKKLLLILSVSLTLGANTRADICYDVDEQAANKAVKIIQTQKEIYQYCSICSAAKPETIIVHNVKNGNPVYVDGVALDLAHTYYKQDNKFFNLGVASGCIEAGEYNIAAELDSFEVHIKERNKIKDLEQKFIACLDNYKTKEQKCSTPLGLQCYDYLMQVHKDARQCYKEIAVELFVEFYGLSKNDAEKRYDTIQKFMYEQYLFLYAESNYCKENNCGVSVYLYSEYATNQSLYNYINKMISYVSR